MQPPLQFLRRIVQLAALTLALPGLTTPAQTTTPQQETSPLAPAPLVHPRPRPQITPPLVPRDAPPDAAPLVVRPAKPRPVNPQSLSGTTPPTTTAHTHTTVPATQPAATRATATPATATQPTATPIVHPQATPQPPKLSPILNRSYVALDPGHGGPDSGARIGDNILEKNVTLALAFRLRSLLAARGFNVVLTRDSDAATVPAGPASAPPIPLTLDLRAGIANHVRPAACLLLHATGRGNGVHLYTSELDPTPDEAALLPWLTAQSAWIPASQQLSFALASALGRSQIPLVSSSASVRPMDSLTCPAIVLELAPETADPASINDAGYQQRVAEAITGALVFWQDKVQPPPKPTAAPATLHPHRLTPRPAAAPAPETQP